MFGTQSLPRRKIYSAVCSLIACADVLTFDATVDNIRKVHLPTAPKEFVNYFDNTLLPLLRDNVAVGFNNWTNNNCESINHVLKQYVQWRPQHLPELLNKMTELIKTQHIEADRAIVGRGNHRLCPAAAKHRLTVDAWTRMSDVQRRKASNRCFRLPIGPASVSTDGTLTVPLTPGAGKKPNQRKRRRAHRTTPLPFSRKKSD